MNNNGGDRINEFETYGDDWTFNSLVTKKGGGNKEVVVLTEWTERSYGGIPL